MSTPKNIVIVSTNDRLGGAAIVSYRLMKALQNIGIDAKMLVMNKQSDNPDITRLSVKPLRKYKFLRERLGIYARNGHNREQLFKVSTASSGFRIDRHPLIRKADAVILNWINQGMLSLKSIEKLASSGKPVIWTMHDMWCMTGICHHSYDCERFMQHCGNCPFLGSYASPSDLSHKVWMKKQKLYAATPDLQFVAVSTWLRDRALQSSLLRGRDIRVIHNAFNSDDFPTYITVDPDKRHHRNFKRVITMGAARIDDPIKGFKYAVDALNKLVDEHPEEIVDTVLILFGSLRDDTDLRRLRFPHILSGEINDPKRVASLFAISDVVLSSSHYESLPGTIIEGMSAGAIPVTFDNGGQKDIIEHRVTGYLAHYPDVSDLANGILWALKCKNSREQMHQEIAERFGSEKIAGQYVNLIKEINERRNK